MVVPNAIKKGVTIDFIENYKENGDRAVIVAPFVSNGERQYIAVVVTRDNAKQRFYLHEVYNKEKTSASFATVRSSLYSSEHIQPQTTDTEVTSNPIRRNSAANSQAISQKNMEPLNAPQSHNVTGGTKIQNGAERGTTGLRASVSARHFALQIINAHRETSAPPKRTVNAPQGKRKFAFL